MSKRIYKTIVLDTSNDYVLGSIHGVLSTCTKGYTRTYGYAISEKVGKNTKTRYRMFFVNTTKGKYNKAKKIIEKLYPALCIFDEDVDLAKEGL